MSPEITYPGHSMNSSVLEQATPSLRAPLVASALILLLFAIHLFLHLGDGTLRDWDEFLTAERSREIAVTHQLCPIQFNFSIDLNKPPLQYYLGSVMFVLHSDIEWGARFWPAVFGCGSLILIGLISRRLCPAWRWAMPFSMAFLAAFPMFRYYSYSAYLETGALFFLLSTLLFSLLGRTRPSFWLAAGLAAGLGSLQKTPLAFGLLLFIAIIDFRRDHRIHISAGCLIGMAITLFWPLLVSIKIGPELMWTSLLNQWWGQRFDVTQAHLPRPCLSVLYDDLLYWAPLLGLILFFAVIKIKAKPNRDRLILTLPIIVYAIALLCMQGRGPRYLFPGVVFLILLTSTVIADFALPILRRYRLILPVLGLTFLPLLAVNPLHMLDPSGKALSSGIPAAEAFRKELKTTDYPVFLYSNGAFRGNMHLAVFLLHGPVNQPFWCYSLDGFIRNPSRPNNALGISHIDDFTILKKEFPTLRMITRVSDLSIWRLEQ
jgi:4-amino-4-deoxy-L-arabinose transferase-like glycosyltransferase